MVQTRSSNVERDEAYGRLLRKAKGFKPHGSIAAALKGAAETILESFPPGSQPDKDEVGNEVRALLPAPSALFSEEYFKGVLFPVKLLKEVCEYYGCLAVPASVLAPLDESVKQDFPLMNHIWLANVYSATTVHRFMHVYFTVKAAEEQQLIGSWTEVPSLGRSVQKELSTATVRKAPQERSEDIEPPTSVEQTQVPSSESQSLPRNQGQQQLPRSVHRQRDSIQRGGDPIGESSVVSISFDSPKKAAAVSAHFRGNRFSGELEESINRTVRDYNICALQLDLSGKQRALFFINAFSGTAKDFFCDNCKPEMSYEQLVGMMLTEYDNDARQLAAQSELENITLRKVMKEEEITDLGRGLKRLIDRIVKLNPQCPQEFRTEKNRIRYLRSAVMKESWADNAISHITTGKYTFNRFVTALREQLQLARERGSIIDSRVAGTFFSGSYPSYGRPPSDVSQRSPKRYLQGADGRQRKNPIGRDGNRMLCSRCGSDNHFRRDCHQGAIRERVREKLSKGTSAVHVLSEMVNHLEDSFQYTESPDQEGNAKENISDVLLFDTLTPNPTASLEAQEGPNDSDPVEKAAELAATHHIASGLSSSDAVHSLPREGDFQ